MNTFVKFALIFVIGVLAGSFAFVSCNDQKQLKKARDEAKFFRDALARCQALQPIVIHDPSWHTIDALETSKPKHKWRDWAHSNTNDDEDIENDSSDCILHWYDDSLHFDDLELAYNITTIGTIEDFAISYKLKAPTIVRVPYADTILIKEAVDHRKWSAKMLIGYPASVFMGAGYQLTNNVELIMGAHTTFAPSRACIMGGISVKL